jgi:nitroimidazol reductase NimA-like FMN-containing flavoprotein (pyridoxamine 5'-phosphate oxidase superfamily)
MQLQVDFTSRESVRRMSEAAEARLAAEARDVLDRIRYVALGTIDEDGRPRTSPVYFVPHEYRDLYWVSDPASHHSRNLERDNRVSGVVFDSSPPPSPEARAVYVTGTASEVPAAELTQHLARAFDPRRGGRTFAAEELTGDAHLRLWVLHVDRCEVHIGARHPTLGTGTDRRMPVDPVDG